MATTFDARSSGPHQLPVTRRHGSVSANDPFGIHAGRDNPGEREMTSRLTIVRLLPDTESPQPYDSLNNIALPDSPGRRSNWAPSPSHLRARSGDGPGRPGRLSFASSSFIPETSTAASFPSSAGLRRRSSTSAFSQRTPLSPQQLCKLARTSKTPHRSSVSPPPSPQSPRRILQPLTTTGGEPVSDAVRPGTMVPASFLPIPDGQFLPFLDRPTEVAAFISTTPTNRLMALLEQAFPVHARLPRPSEGAQGSPSPPLSPCNSEFSTSLASALETNNHSPPPLPMFRDTDPAEWSYSTLLAWMCTVPRSQADDTEWVRRIRACVMAHSEQICVSLLSALGVPMEGLLDHGSEPLTVTQTIRSETSAVPDILITSSDDRATPSPLQLPSALEKRTEEDEDAFRLDIAPISYPNSPTIPEERPEDLSDLPLVAERARSGSISNWTSSSRSSSRTMESIGESENESELEHNVQVHQPIAQAGSNPTPDEPLSGSATARAGSPVGSALARAQSKYAPKGSLLFSADPQSRWNPEQLKGIDAGYSDEEDMEDVYGLCISTCPRSSDSPTLPSSQPLGVLPIPLSPKQASRKTANVAHVLSGTPGHAGFTWRPGGPLFPTSFAGPKSESSDEEVNVKPEAKGRTLVTSTPVMTSKSKPAMKPRSRSRPPLQPLTTRSARISHIPSAPPNSPDVYRA